MSSTREYRLYNAYSYNTHTRTHMYCMHLINYANVCAAPTELVIWRVRAAACEYIRLYNIYIRTECVTRTTRHMLRGYYFTTRS